jgi:BASS family bile acid:Na+ symporter
MPQAITTAFLCYAAYGLLRYNLAGLINNNNKSMEIREDNATNNNCSYERTAGLISISYINNVLVAVFALQFFGTIITALAALYNMPYMQV